MKAVLTIKLLDQKEEVEAKEAWEAWTKADHPELDAQENADKANELKDCLLYTSDAADE